MASSGTSRPMAPLARLGGGDSLAADGTRDGDRADRGQRAAGVDAELIDGARGAGLDVQVPSVAGDCRVDGPRAGGGGAGRPERAAAVVAVAGQRAAAGVGGVERGADRDDPAGGGLAGRGPV